MKNTPNPIQVDARKSCGNPEMQTGRPRRFSTSAARKGYYHLSRQIRFALRLTQKSDLDVATTICSMLPRFLEANDELTY